jgi:hypothetical protein
MIDYNEFQLVIQSNLLYPADNMTHNGTASAAAPVRVVFLSPLTEGAA